MLSAEQVFRNKRRIENVESLWARDFYYLHELLEQHRNGRVGQDVNLEHDVPWPTGPFFELDIVVLQNMHKNDLDLIAGKESSRASIVTKSELHAVVTGARELVFVCRLWCATQLVKAKTVKLVWITPFRRRLVENVGIALHNGP